MKNFILFIYIFCNSSFLGQSLDDSLLFNFFNPSIKLYAIGEDHFVDDIELQCTIIEYLHKNTNIDVFIFEYSVEIGLIFNEYVMYGRNEKEVDEICALLHKTVSKKTKIILNLLKNYNLTNSHKIEVRGVDMFRFYKLKRQIKGLLLIFPELKQIDCPIAKRCFEKQKTNNYKRKKSTEIINALITEMYEQKTLYSRCLGKKMSDYEKCLNELKFYYMNYNYQKSDSIRENTMSQNLMNIVDSNAVSVLICGATHAMFKENDTWYHGYQFTSMVSDVKKKYIDKVYSIITHTYEKKLYRFFPEFNLLNKELKLFFENQAKKYVIVTGAELTEHLLANERCNMVIIENK